VELPYQGAQPIKKMGLIAELAIDGLLRCVFTPFTQKTNSFVMKMQQYSGML
jgi:hypothetical protein